MKIIFSENCVFKFYLRKFEKENSIMKFEKCCLCDKPLGEFEIGCNAEPLAVGRCCQHCDDTQVVPFRIRQICPGISDEDIQNIVRVKHIFRIRNSLGM